MTTNATQTETAAWLRAHPGATLAEFREAFPALPRSTAHRRYHATPPPAPPRRNPKGVPAKDLAPDDRARIVATVRDLHATLARLAERTVREVEEAQREGRPIRLDRDTSQAALNLQRMAAGLIETHPGLLEIARDGEASTATDEDLDAILAALGVEGADEPGADDT